MTYATEQDMIDRFSADEIRQLTDTAHTGLIDSAALAKTLVDTDAQINTYLQSVYTLPFATTPPVLVRVACDIARYHLYDIRAGELVRERYKDALSFLEKVAKGLANLGEDAATQVASTAPNGVKGRANKRVFSANHLGDY